MPGGRLKRGKRLAAHDSANTKGPHPSLNAAEPTDADSSLNTAETANADPSLETDLTELAELSSLDAELSDSPQSSSDWLSRLSRDLLGRLGGHRPAGRLARSPQRRQGLKRLDGLTARVAGVGRLHLLLHQLEQVVRAGLHQAGLLAELVKRLPEGDLAGVERDLAVFQFVLGVVQTDRITTLPGEVGHGLAQKSVLVGELDPGRLEELVALAPFLDPGDQLLGPAVMPRCTSPSI